MREEMIVRDPKIMLGKPVIKGTRITVELIVRKIADGFTIDDIVAGYPHLTAAQVQAALEFAARMIADEIILEA